MNVTVAKKTIPAKVWQEAKSISSNIYRMNAKSAIAYAFNCNENEITYGMYLDKWDWNTRTKFDGYIEFKI